jgi:hypothetical protein
MSQNWMSIYEVEEMAMAALAAELNEPFQMVDKVLNQISRVWGLNDTAETLSNGRIVRTLLLQRLQNDLRCCRLLAERGYSLQAASQAAGVFESFVNVAAIVDESTALRWLNHDKVTTSFGSIKSLSESACEIIFKGPDQLKIRERANHLYSQYQQLCMPKHLNPLVEGLRGFRLEGNQIEFHLGPDVTLIGIVHAWFSVERAARFAFLGICVFVQNDKPPITDEFVRELMSLLAELDNLQAVSAKKWPENYIDSEA